MSIKLYYDGECPFCKEYSKYIKLREKYQIDILDARENLDKIRFFKDRGFDINSGFIIEFEENGKIYHGATASQILDKLIEKKTVLDKTISFIVNSSVFKTVIYPFVKIVRVFLLKILGRDPNINY